MKFRALLAAILLATACTKVYNNNEDAGGLTPLNPTTPIVKTDTIEYRVTGSGVNQVQIRYSNSIDGTSIITTGLPWFFTVQNTKDTVFLSLDVATTNTFVGGAVGTFLSGQIFVNGVLFREANSTLMYPVLSVSGQYRR